MIGTNMPVVGWKRRTPSTYKCHRGRRSRRAPSSPWRTMGWDQRTIRRRPGWRPARPDAVVHVVLTRHGVYLRVGVAGLQRLLEALLLSVLHDLRDSPENGEDHSDDHEVGPSLGVSVVVNQGCGGQPVVSVVSCAASDSSFPSSIAFQCVSITVCHPTWSDPDRGGTHNRCWEPTHVAVEARTPRRSPRRSGEQVAVAGTRHFDYPVARGGLNGLRMGPSTTAKATLVWRRPWAAANPARSWPRRKWLFQKLAATGRRETTSSSGRGVGTDASGWAARSQDAAWATGSGETYVTVRLPSRRSSKTLLSGRS